MENAKDRCVEVGQIRRILTAGGINAALYRSGLLNVLLEQIPRRSKGLVRLPLGNLVGETLELEKTTELSLGGTFDRIMSPIASEESRTHFAARAIMGENFFGIPEVSSVFGAMTDAKIRALAEIPFSAATLKACRDSHVLFADIGISIVDIRIRMWMENMFTAEANSWYDRQEFAESIEPASWRLLRTSPIEGSENLDWSKQFSIIGKDEQVPTARQVTYALMLMACAISSYRRFLQDCYVRTSSRLDSVTGRSKRPSIQQTFEALYQEPFGESFEGQCAYLGRFRRDAGGLFIGRMNDEMCRQDLRLLSSKKPQRTKFVA
ncbi:MAG: hypothetical protein WCT28_03740 [Patescibacteria group bacterium]|jgi:hypothetical protein